MSSTRKNTPGSLCSLVVLLASTVATVPAVGSDAPVKTQSMAVESQSAEDTAAPETFITVPVIDYTAGRTAVFRGYATDTGGAGINRVRIAIQARATNQWFNFIDKSFGAINDSAGNPVGIRNADLSDAIATYANWSISVTLPDGDYQFYALAVDGAENSQYTGKGVWPVSVPFSVK